jgi:hypothetical protein
VGAARDDNSDRDHGREVERDDGKIDRGDLNGQIRDDSPPLIPMMDPLMVPLMVPLVALLNALPVVPIPVSMLRKTGHEAV